MRVRSPYPSDSSNNVRNVNNNGNVNNNNANNSNNGVAVDCEKARNKVNILYIEINALTQGIVVLTFIKVNNKDDVVYYNSQYSNYYCEHLFNMVINLNSVKDTVCAFENLYKAMYKCKHDVMWKDSVAGFIKNGLVNCYTLSNELMNDKYRISSYDEFIIREPKERRIISTRFRDRVFQRSLCDNYLYDALTKSFIYDNAACQRGKGTQFSRKRLETHLQRYYRKHGNIGYVYQLDLHNFYNSTSHSVAIAAIEKRVKDE